MRQNTRHWGFGRLPQVHIQLDMNKIVKQAEQYAAKHQLHVVMGRATYGLNMATWRMTLEARGAINSAIDHEVCTGKGADEL